MMNLEVQNLHFRYDSNSYEALTGVSFSIRGSSYWCLAGPNGSGKSTLLKLICGLLPRHQMSGEIRWDDKSLSQWKPLELARAIAFVPGVLRTSFPVTVEELVLQGRYAHSKFWARPSKKDHQIADAAIARVGLEQHRNALVTEISSGEAQLAMIARALAQDPKVLILDESTANLDLAYQRKVFDLLGELNRPGGHDIPGVTILLVSHDLNLAAEFCPNVLWLNHGKVYTSGSMTATLTPALMEDLYKVGAQVEIGKNPVTNRPKVFWR